MKVRKKDLTKEEKRKYEIYRDSNIPNTIHTYFKTSESQQERNIRPFLAMIFNTAYSHSISALLNRLCRNKSRFNTLNAFMKSALIEDEYKIQLIRMGDYRFSGTLAYPKIKFKDPASLEKAIVANPNYFLGLALEGSDFELLKSINSAAPALLWNWTNSRYLGKFPRPLKESLWLLDPQKSSSRMHCFNGRRDMSEEFIFKMLAVVGRFIKYIPNDILTEEMCLAAVKKSGTCIKFVPKKFKSKEVCDIATNKAPSSLASIPGENQNKRLVVKAAFKNPGVLKYLKKTKK